MDSKFNVICPNYLCYDTLPEAADIFYHGSLTYLIPTGISPTEWENVLDFPQYCIEKNIDLPQKVWLMSKKYFECSRQAVECSDILQPLGKKILKISTIYPRDIEVIEKTRRELSSNKKLLESFKKSADDLRFLSRELFSHIFLEVYLEKGVEFVKDYIETNFSDEERFIELLATVILNRMCSLYKSEEMKYIVYNYNWYPFLIEFFEYIQGGESSEKTDEIDTRVHRLFTEIVSPVFGRCDSAKKTEYIAHVAKKQKDAIDSLKETCQDIVEISMFYVNDKIDLRDSKMKSLVIKRVIEPLSYMMSKPKKDVKQILADFTLDSTVIGGILSLTQGFDANTVGMATAAGAISTGLKYIRNDKETKELSAKFILKELKKNKVKYLEYENILRQISIEQIDI